MLSVQKALVEVFIWHLLFSVTCKSRSESIASLSAFFQYLILFVTHIIAESRYHMCITSEIITHFNNYPYQIIIHNGRC